MDNPIRNCIQEHVEIKRIMKYVLLPPRCNILDIGCGTGNSSKLIKKYFKIKKINAVDIDKRMIAVAKRNNKDRAIHFEVGDATRLRFKNNSFDAVFDIGVIHHIPQWKKCLQELKRVLKPGGQLIIEDISLETFSTSLGIVMKKMLDHPYNKMYKEKEFIESLKKLNFKINIKKRYDFGVRYFIVVAQKE
jgi:ubiquinone/menaquinone biosynthesis C-methylase UbiE